jgi:hypothetical protein
LGCEGCGKCITYSGGARELLQAHGVEATGAVVGRRLLPSGETVERWLPAPPALPWWVPNAYIVAVIAIGLALITFGVLGRSGGGGEGGDAGESVPSVSAPAAIAPSPATEQPARRKHRVRGPELNRVEVADRFAIGVPEGWLGGTSGGAVVIESPSREAEVRIFLQPGQVRPSQFVRQAISFLRSEHPDGKVRRLPPTRIGPLRAEAIVDHYPGGAVRVRLLSGGGYSYLLLNRIERHSDRAVRAESGAAMRSFRTL